jgi:hypothetical protein
MPSLVHQATGCGAASVRSYSVRRSMGSSNFNSWSKTKEKAQVSITSRYMESPGTGKLAQALGKCCKFQRRHVQSCARYRHLRYMRGERMPFSAKPAKYSFHCRLRHNMRQQRALHRLNSHVPCRSRRNIRPSRSTRYWGGEDEVFSKGVTALRKFSETRSIDRLMPHTPSSVS